MAIQKINLGTEPLGDGGDTYRSANTKINENFTNKDHAASRLVGKANGNLVEMTADGIAGTGWGTTSPPKVPSTYKLHLMEGTGVYKVDSADITATGAPTNAGSPLVLLNMPYAPDYSVQLAVTRDDSSKMFFRGSPKSSAGVWREVYHTGNTTFDSNKNLKTSSPVVRVFSNRLDKIHEANDLPIKYTRNGVGDYTIEGTTGLRKDDWQIVIPEDEHRNQLIAFTIEDDNGTIRLKTYKRTFSMDTYTFGPDLSSPLDIPRGRWVDLHFNDIPQEHLEELEPVEEPVEESE